MSDTYREPLRKVGIALIITGLLDIAWMIYSIAHQLSYNSSFNIFAVIAGILLMRGGLNTARVVIFMSAMTLPCCILMAPLIALSTPIGYFLVYFKLHPFACLADVGILIAITCLLIWIYSTLTTPIVLNAIASKIFQPNYANRRPIRGFIIGTLLILIVGITLGLSLKGQTNEAIVRARQKVGNSYNFFVTRININTFNGTTHVSALVTAYNDHEIRYVPVAW
jgi:hypothetical protein